MATALDQSAKSTYLRVSFRWDIITSNQSQKYTDLSTDLPDDFIATPEMSVRFPKNTSTFEKLRCEIDLPIDAFTTRISNRRPHAAISVLVEEITRPETDFAPLSNLLTPFRGRVTNVRRNFEGQTGLVRIEARSAKNRLKIPTGLPVMHHCPFDTYGPGSNLNRASFNHPQQITAIVSNVVTIVNTTGQVAGFFNNGHMELEGVSLKIRDWDDDLVFTLIERPPADWLFSVGGSAVNIYAGSNKTIEDVRDKLSNEANFGGIGFAIPAYHPTFEGPPEECG